MRLSVPVAAGLHRPCKSYAIYLITEEILYQCVHLLRHLHMNEVSGARDNFDTCVRGVFANTFEPC